MHPWAKSFHGVEPWLTLNYSEAGKGIFPLSCHSDLSCRLETTHFHVGSPLCNG